MATVIQHMEECSLVLMTGQIELSDYQVLEGALQVAASSGHKNVWVDCEYAVFFSKEVLRKLLFLAEKAKVDGVTLLFYQMSPSLKKSMRDSDPERLIQIVGTIKDASHVSHAKLNE